MRRLVVLIAALVVGALLAAPALGSQRNFRAHLVGSNEVPAVETDAQGQAIFQLNSQGDALSYKLVVANIIEVTQAHIHCGTAGVNGPVVAFLYGFVSPAEGERFDGVLAEGTITAASVIPRPDSPACPGGIADFDELLAAMEAGNTYTNVHTIDWPGGEIRGQNH